MGATAVDTKVAKPKRRWLSVIALSAAAFADWCENDALSLLWPRMSQSLGLSLGRLGIVLGVSCFVNTVTTPLWGYAADHFSRKKMLIWVTGVWGLWTAVLGLSQNLFQLVVLRIVSALGLGALWPITFSLIGDLFTKEERGRAAGIFNTVSFLGTLAAYAILPPLAAAGAENWRWGFVIMGLLSAASGLFLFLVDDPPRGASEPELNGVITEEAARQYAFRLADLTAIARIPSWRWLLLNEVVDAISWVALNGWAFTWFDSLGMGDQAIVVMSLLMLGVIFGHVLFGWLGDVLDRRYPDYGRTVMGLVGLLVTIPALTGFLILGGRGAGFLMGFGLLAGLGLSSVGTGARWPISQDVLVPEVRGTGRAVIDMLGGIVAALVMTSSGYLVDALGGNVSTMLLLMVPIPKLIGALLWIPLLKTYRHDYARVRKELARRRAEIMTLAE